MPPGNEDVQISVGITLQALKRQLKEVRKLLNNNFSAAGAKRFNRLSGVINKVSGDYKNLGKSMLGLPDNYDKNFTNVNRELRNLGNVSRKTGNDLNKGAKRALSKLTDEGKKIEGRFQAWALSIMFFGQTVLRIFSSIWKSASKTFNEVMSSVDGTTTSFQMLNGSVTYLKFVAGQALEPIAAALMPIIDRISTWITNNEKVFRTMVVIGSIIGFILVTVGTLVLAVGGIITGFAKVGVAIKAVGGLIMTFGIGPILAIVAAVVLVYLAIKNNWMGIADFLKNTFGVVWETVKGLVEPIKKLFSGIIEFLEGLFTGDFEKVWNGLVKIVLSASEIMMKLLKGAAAVFYNAFVFVINAIKNGLINFVKIIVSTVRALIQLANKIPGISIGTDGLEKAERFLEDLKGSTDLKYYNSKDMAEENKAIGKAHEKIQVNVELDGEKVARSVSKRQVDEAERHGATGGW